MEKGYAARDSGMPGFSDFGGSGLAGAATAGAGPGPGSGVDAAAGGAGSAGAGLSGFSGTLAAGSTAGAVGPGRGYAREGVSGIGAGSFLRTRAGWLTSAACAWPGPNAEIVRVIQAGCNGRPVADASADWLGVRAGRPAGMYCSAVQSRPRIKTNIRAAGR